MELSSEYVTSQARPPPHPGLDSTIARYCLLWASTTPLWNSHENFLVGHPSWECFRSNSLNFGVPMEHEASEFPKGLVLGRDGNIHIRLTRFTPLGDVGCYKVGPTIRQKNQLCKKNCGGRFTVRFTLFQDPSGFVHQHLALSVGINTKNLCRFSLNFSSHHCKTFTTSPLSTVNLHNPRSY
ncbi:hypothetical protein DVH24_035967 [Malus domestica]|uniref:Uncharacterized protein n=1 Tax=Malus domestica TaxID=3750 RepID=A0A498JMX1_MALDO|nr:hypothetical protein DVH24_035967 [Malus domestica]